MAEAHDARYSEALILNRDLMFGSRIKSALTQIGLRARFVPDTEQFVSAFMDLDESTAIAILDMNGPVDWEQIRAVTAMPNGAPILAFGPHVDVGGRRAAKAAGVTRIVSNGQFHSELQTLIQRYQRR